MNSGMLAWIIPLTAILGGAIGWLGRQYQYHREARRQATFDASKILKEKKALIVEQIAEINDDGQKEGLQLQLDEVNTTLLGLHSERLRRTLKAAGLPPEEALIAEGLNQLLPEQVNELKEEITEVKNLPQSESTWDLLAQASAYYYAEQYQEAKETYDRILKLTPNDPNTLNSRGITYGQLEKYDEAITDFNRSLELKPNAPGTLCNRGNAYILLGMYDEALSDLNQSLRLNPSDPTTFHNLGCLYERLERYDEALSNFNRSLEIRPDNPDSLNGRGRNYAAIGKYKEAFADFNRSLELKPDDPDTLYCLSCLFALRGKSDDALAYLEKAISGNIKYKEEAKTDKDFDNIREDPRFKKLIEGD